MHGTVYKSEYDAGFECARRNDLLGEQRWAVADLDGQGFCVTLAEPKHEDAEIGGES